MRLVLIAFSTVAVMALLSACSDGDVPDDVPRTVPPAESIAKPVRVEQNAPSTPVVPLRRAPVQGEGPIFET